DVSILSVAPPLFYYWAQSDFSLYIAQMVYDEILNFITQAPGKLEMMATVPMNNVKMAIDELKRIVKKSNGRTRFVQIGTNIEGAQLDSPTFEPFFNIAEELGITVFIHPYYIGKKPG